MKWLHFILSHSIFIAFCAVALCFQTALLLHFNLAAFFYAFIFFSTVCSYNFYWLLSGFAFANRSLPSLYKKQGSNIIVFFIAAIGMLLSLYSIPGLWPLAAIALLLNLVYAIPLMPFKFFQKTREAGLLKTILLAFTWTFVTVYMPYKQVSTAHPLTLIMLFNNRFLFMLMLCIIFDARDTTVDKIRGLQSLATLVKPPIIRYIMIFIFMAYIINGIWIRIYYHEPRQIVALLVTGLVTAIVYFFSLKKQGYFFYYFGVDGLMLFSALSTYVASI